jgi:hypothetical protein
MDRFDGQAGRSVSLRGMAKAAVLALGIAGFAVGVSGALASDDGWDDNNWVFASGGSSGSGWDDDDDFASGGSGFDDDVVFGPSGGSGGSGGFDDSDWDD